ncbi:MAG: glucose-6-phosphate dehydrogenase [Candidatus Eremiobacter antarcticus]|nr:glucose-6-phosphate dehydrogenase [Candidatus Eremiobacteraeota bacterium]MBC5808370.1 glucose-6-phosphate dehydrogenase [Candidatus Eremiobacteraeota bacterium]PZR63736.1 MAG: glucose-6-phosphate dehydrogenase [Candidatus Eremiobacter sp. RRmetagenome_bin22]
MATIAAPSAAPAEIINPFREGLRLEGATTPCLLVIFGASGDLTKRKLLPAIYNLAQASLLPPSFAMIGFASTQMDDAQFRDVLRDAVANSSEVRVRDPAVLAYLQQRCYYISGDFGDPAAFGALKAQLGVLDQRYGTSGNRIFYTATPASLYPPIAEKLHESALTVPEPGLGHFVRIIVEKPFGHDLASAKMLNAELEKFFQEGQIYRIDHYLGKETVQNILVLRFANGIFEPIWNRRYVDSVQITVAESLGIEDRGKFYEETGVVRDVIQNHALQLLSLVAMEPPLTFDARDFRDEKIRVVEAVHPICKEDVPNAAVRGQYGPGFVAGVNVPGYRQERNVAPDSIVPTYAAFKFTVDNWRWAGVPFYVRSGKRMPKRVTEIAMQFKEVPHLPFRKSQVEMIAGNVLSLRIQPDEGITLKFGAKVPGPVMRIRSVAMDFDYGATFGTEDASPYERLILDCMKGDQTLFDRDDGVEAAWSLIDPILQVWQEHPTVKFSNYAAGTWGPAEADELLARDGKSWRLL